VVTAPLATTGDHGDGTLGEDLESATATQVLTWAIEKFGGSFGICTSFQPAGVVILDLAARIAPAVRVFTLDTGRLPEETYRMIEEIRNRYGIAVETVLPDPTEVQAMVSQHGPNLFYEEPAKRLLCCHVRKTLPLQRKLLELGAYAVGLRRDQTESRANVRKVEANSVPVKISPLADWSRQDVQKYTTKHHLPVHPLYQKGYASIGCAPCTRSVRPEEGERSGRWWWEKDTRKECGIHFSGGGQRVRPRLDVLVGEILMAAGAAVVPGASE
jgi:phosphoadenylyl-sulfate reductase (thioredoxin)